jgi:hypothetical protein
LDCAELTGDQGHERFSALINADLGMAVLVSVVHTVAMIAAGGGLACLPHPRAELRIAELV